MQINEDLFITSIKKYC